MDYRLKWYQTWKGISLAGLSAVVLIGGSFFVFLTAKYWLAIKRGEGGLLKQKIFQGFERSTTTTAGAGISRDELESKDSPFLGNPNAKLVIVEFLDFKCPNSKAAFPIMRQIIEKYSYKVKLIVRGFPGESIHPGANKLTELAMCANEQGKFWQTHDLLFNEQSNIGVNLSDFDISNLAKDAGLDGQLLNRCLKEGRVRVKVNKDYADGYRAGAAGTPTFFVNGEKIEGVAPMEMWENLLKKF